MWTIKQMGVFYKYNLRNTPIIYLFRIRRGWARWSNGHIRSNDRNCKTSACRTRHRSAIQVPVDDDREKNGWFFLTGSYQPSLQKGIAQSLADRTSILILLPLSMDELAQEGRLDVLSYDQLFDDAGRMAIRTWSTYVVDDKNRDFKKLKIK